MDSGCAACDALAEHYKTPGAAWAPGERPGHLAGSVDAGEVASEVVPASPPPSIAGGAVGHLVEVVAADAVIGRCVECGQLVWGDGPGGFLAAWRRHQEDEYAAERAAAMRRHPSFRGGR